MGMANDAGSTYGGEQIDRVQKTDQKMDLQELYLWGRLCGTELRPRESSTVFPCQPSSS
jgi:hypothetical protein